MAARVRIPLGLYRGIAQLVEHMSEEHGVGSSILPSSARNRSSVVEHSADNRAVTSSNLVGSTLEDWQSG